MNATNRKAETIMTSEALEQMEESRFSRQRFGGGEAGERAAYEALSAHEAQLVDGTRVRVYRGQPNGLIGTVDGQTSGHSVYVLAPDGLRWIVETRNLELVAEHRQDVQELAEETDTMDAAQLVRVSSIAAVMPLGGIVAKNDRFEVFAFRTRRGAEGERCYQTYFEAVEVLSREPRKIRPVILPDTKRSNLRAICAYLATLAVRS